jgi:2-haloacid dehalogenase
MCEHQNGLLKTCQGVGNQSRRTFISKACTGCLLAAGSFWIPKTAEPERVDIRAVLFDGFALFDPRPVSILTEEIFPGKGKDITDLWRNRQLEYCWLRQAAQQYKNFTETTQDALVFATNKAGVSLTDADRNKLMDAYQNMDLWPDVLTVLRFLKAKGYSIGILSNMTWPMLNANISRNCLMDYISSVLSTDQVKSYKPSPKSYQLGTDILQLKTSEILFVASSGWDAAGASWYGYPTFWVNRLNAPAEELNVTLSATDNRLDALMDLL